MIVQAGITQAGALGWGTLGVAAVALDQSPAVVTTLFVLAIVSQLMSWGLASPSRRRAT